MWFEQLTGFAEPAVGNVAAQFEVEGESLRSVVNGSRWRHGRFESVALADLRRQVGGASSGAGGGAGVGPGHPDLGEVVADVRALHGDPENSGALFQVASQFNALEMVSPQVTPEDGVDRYETDHTQGPACAVACGAGTIYRNYLLPLPGGTGQTATRQLNLLQDLAAALGVSVEMQNGYALPPLHQLEDLSVSLLELSGPQRAELMGHLRVGVHWNTEVTLAGAGHVVTQVFCSALPVAYSSHSSELWEPFARLVLGAAYEATLWAGVINAEATGNKRVYLTLLGGGAFGNETAWIVDAMDRALHRCAGTGLEVNVVSHGRSNPALARLLPSGRGTGPPDGG